MVKQAREKTPAPFIPSTEDRQLKTDHIKSTPLPHSDVAGKWDTTDKGKVGRGIKGSGVFDSCWDYKGGHDIEENSRGDYSNILTPEQLQLDPIRADSQAAIARLADRVILPHVGE